MYFKPSFRLQKQDISYLPFSELSNVANADLDNVVKDLGLQNYSSWMMPQLLALFGSFKTFKNDKGEYIAEPFLEHNIGKDPHLRGIWKACARLKRSALVKGQNSPSMSMYSALVPLIMAGVKRFQSVNYSEWSLDSIPYLVDNLLSQAMLVDPKDVPDLSVDKIMEIRKQGLTTVSGASAGKVVNPTSKWSLTGIRDTELGHLPTHAITMICQTWVAHPSLRHELMVLHPNDWDGMPAPLVDTEILKKTEAVTNLGSDNPWA